MKKSFLFVFLSLFALVGISLAQIQKEVHVEISGLGLVIGTPSNISLGSVSAGTTVEKTFNNYFWVEDLRGVNTGYYTTIQCDGLYGPDNFIITGVQLSGNLVELLQGNGNQTDIYSNLDSWTDITTPQLYFYKNDNVPLNYHGNKYGNKPSIRISIPNNAPAGTYKGKITYTLYDRSFEF
ncbi:MAG TPA: hypothetical protein PLP73_00400 [Candidatus Absconditabacterales bacterium]|nr:hypothetical protein [Candidatus Absconditabacterales bacterium]